MKARQFLEKIEELGMASFTMNDAVRITGKKPEYVRVFLHRLAKKGEVERVARGAYAVTQDPFTRAGIASPNGYVSFLSALSFHGLTTQVPHAVQMVLNKRKKEVAHGNTKIVFVRMAPEHFFGFQKQGAFRMAEPEKAILDGLCRPQHLPLSEALWALPDVDAEKITAYAERFGSPVTAKRLGFLMEKTGQNADALLKLTNRKFDVLNPALPHKGRKNKKWHLVVNEELQ